MDRGGGGLLLKGFRMICFVCLLYTLLRRLVSNHLSIQYLCLRSCCVPAGLSCFDPGRGYVNLYY